MMNIVIPMAGMSSRFTKAGFTLPKYMLYLKDKSLFYLVLKGFEQYFESACFLFIARDIFGTYDFIEKECQLLGIKNYRICILESPTSGQAETVYRGVEVLDGEGSMLVFNIDSIRVPMRLPDWITDVDGYLEVFEGSGSNWSYAKTEDGTVDTRVVLTAEKKEISRFCSTGLYYFAKIDDYREAYKSNLNSLVRGERYVAPLYNDLINRGKTIRIDIIDKTLIKFCGVPEEYFDCLAQFVVK